MFFHGLLYCCLVTDGKKKKAVDNSIERGAAQAAPLTFLLHTPLSDSKISMIRR